jgi:DnaJ like chaperone protein
MSYAKWIGGALGWAVGGPIGGLLGFAFGAMVGDKSLATEGTQRQRAYDPRTDKRYQSYRHHTRPGDFISAMVVLSAAVMKADGKYMKSELDYIRDFFKRQFNETVAIEQVGVLKELLKKDIPVKDVCEQIRYYMEQPMRLQLLHYLLGIAKADGKVETSEVQLIQRIATWLGISEKDFESLQAMYYKDASSSYKILEIDEKATDEEVKKAYRRMAMKYHPDKVRDLGPEHQKAAQEKFVKVQEAYEHIKSERDMK